MITFLQAFVLGALQGVTELFPISSLGHSVILPTLLNWHIDQTSPYFLIFLVATHLATALVLFFFFLSDWKKIVLGIVRSLRNRVIDPADTYAKIGWLLIVATIPAGLLGVLFQEKLKVLFASALFASIFLTLNGVVLYGAEQLKKRFQTMATDPDTNVAQLSWKQSIYIGLAQCFALFPGFSRTGTTLAGGLLNGLSHEAAVRFSFLLATPIIFGAAILELPGLTIAGTAIIYPVIVGFIAAACAAYFSVRFLTKYFKTKTLYPFAVYCVLAGLISLSILLIR